jgi:hypothetical protein
MKKLIGILALTGSISAMAVDGYKDIYIDKDEDVVVHGLFCGDDINKLSRFKPAVIYTNTGEIEKGTYYFRSQYGEYSLTFNTTDSDLVMVRGLLQGGKTAVSDMKQEYCIVKYGEGLPPAVQQYVTQTVIKAGDSSLEQYELLSGKPATGKGKY